MQVWRLNGAAWRDQACLCDHKVSGPLLFTRSNQVEPGSRLCLPVNGLQTGTGDRDVAIGSGSGRKRLLGRSAVHLCLLRACLSMIMWTRRQQARWFLVDLHQCTWLEVPQSLW